MLEPRSTKPLVLLATGDNQTRLSIRGYLKDVGFAVVAVNGGVECVASLRRLAPDAIILDSDLLWGGADGVLSHLRSDGRSQPPIVLLVTETTAYPVPVSIADPVVAVINKPVLMKTLLSVLRSTMNVIPVEQAEH